MKIIIFSLVFLSAVGAKADIIKCGFTEPFFSIVIDTDAKTLTRLEPDYETTFGGTKTTLLSKKVKVVKIASKIVSPVIEVPRYKVIADGKAQMMLELDYQGSDGMSDFVYPYSTKFESFYGGCESDKLKRLSAVLDNQ